MVKSANETKKNIINYQGKGVTAKRQFKKRKQRRVLKGMAPMSETAKPTLPLEVTQNKNYTGEKGGCKKRVKKIVEKPVTKQ